MRLMLLTAVTLCFAACSGCEEKKTEPTPAAVAPAPTPAPQPTRQQLQAAVTRHSNLRRLEPRTTTLNGRQEKILSSKFRPLRRSDLQANPAEVAPATSEPVTEAVKQ